MFVSIAILPKDGRIIALKKNHRVINVVPNCKTTTRESDPLVGLPFPEAVKVGELPSSGPVCILKLRRVLHLPCPSNLDIVSKVLQQPSARLKLLVCQDGWETTVALDTVLPAAVLFLCVYSVGVRQALRASSETGDEMR